MKRIFKGLRNRAIRLTAAAAVGSAVVRSLEAATARRENLLWVLTYHRIAAPGEREDLDPATWSATPVEFDRQMELLTRISHVVTMQEVLNAFQGGRQLPPRAVLITFDDAYRDFRDHAWPILRHRNLPATLFVPSGFPDAAGRTFWWDRLHQAIHSAKGRTKVSSPIGRLPLRTPAERVTTFQILKQHLNKMHYRHACLEVEQIAAALDAPPPANEVLGWDDLRALHTAGITLGAHTQNHPLLDHVSPEEARQEISASLEDLRREIGHVLPIFAYPGGALNETAVRLLAEEKIELALTTRRGVNKVDSVHPLRIRRINVGKNTTPNMLRVQLALGPEFLNRILPS